MRRVVAFVGMAMLVLGVGASAAPASAETLRPDPPPAWFTEAFRAQVDAAGTRGVPLDDGPGPQEGCPGVQPDSLSGSPVVSAGTCVIYPAGCTANFIYYAGGSYYIGTAGHCVSRVDQSVYMQVSTPGDHAAIANVGSVAQFAQRGYEPGNDWAVIEIRHGFAVDPRMPQGGPSGIYTGCDPAPVTHYGHGYEIGVTQGKLVGGLATKWFDDAYGSAGVGLRGDSGSGVMLADGRAAGDLTHRLGRYELRFPGSQVAGTRLTKILAALPDFYLVNEDGSLARETATGCGLMPPPQPILGSG